MIYAATAKGGFKMTAPFDPNSKNPIGIIYRPGVWTANTVYYQRAADDYDIVIPTVFKGKYYKVNNPGKSGATEPVWPGTVPNKVTDGDILWEAVAYNLMPPEISIVTSTWTATAGVTLGTEYHTDGVAQVMITSVDPLLTTFTVTNHIVKSNGGEDDVSIIFKVADR